MEMRQSRFWKIRLLLAIPVAGGGAWAQNQTGLRFIDEGQYRSIPLAAAPLRGELPETIDLSNRFPKPGHQGQQPSCVAWASAYALKTFQECQEHRWDANAKDRQFSPAFVYNQIKLPGGGSHFTDAFDILTEQGAVSLVDFPYNAGDDTKMPSRALKQKASPFRIATWRRVNAQSNTEVRGQLAAAFPVLIGAEVGDAFQNHRGDAVFSLDPGEKINGSGHAMVVIGYDDRKKAYRVINSWGTDWGDEGLAWVSYSTFQRMVREAYVVQDIVSVLNDDKKPKPEDIRQVQDDPPTPTRFPMAQLGIPGILHNQFQGGQPGMVISPVGRASNVKGKSVQIVARFSMPDGRTLVAHPLERVMRDINGQVAVGTQKMVSNQDDVNLSVSSFYIPYYALNMQATGGMMQYNLAVTIFLYIDDFEIARSMPAPFVLKW